MSVCMTKNPTDNDFIFEFIWYIVFFDTEQELEQNNKTIYKLL